MVSERAVYWRNDHVSIEWDNPERTAVLIIYQGSWTWDDAHKLYDVLVEMLDEAGYKVHLLIHFDNPHWFPRDHLSELHHFTRRIHSNIGHVFVIGLPAFFCEFFKIVVAAYPDLHLTIAFPQSVEEARALLPSSLPPVTSIFTLHWFNTAKTILCITMLERWTWEDAAEVRRYYGALIDDLAHTVDVIVDVRRWPKLPQGIYANLEKRAAAVHERTGLTIMVGLEPLYQDAIKAFIESNPNTRFPMTFADTLEDAEKMLMQAQSRRVEEQQAGVWAAWDNPEHTCIRIVFCGRWQWEDVHEAAYRSRRMMDSVVHKVDFIIDMQPPNLTPSHFMTHVGRLFALMHPRLGVIALVTKKSAGLFRLFCKLNNSLNIQYVVTDELDDARAILWSRRQHP